MWLSSSLDGNTEHAFIDGGYRLNEWLGVRVSARIPVGAAEGCDLLTVILKIKRSQPAAAPTGPVFATGE
jgi:hypothetical protein